MQGYCMKCKETRDMKSEEKVTMKNGRPATRGVCSTCGTKMFKIGKGATLTGGALKRAKPAVSKKSKKSRKSKKSKKYVK